MVVRRLIGCAGLALAASIYVTGAMADELLDRARKLLSDGQAQQAYTLLAGQEGVRAGEPEYDYLLGLAAIDAGESAAATLALERVIAIDSRNAGARVDLGRAWFQLGNLEKAEQEFLKLLELSPPELARKTIERYLQAIEQRRQAARTTVSPYVEFGLGYDSNVNNSTDNETIYAPLFGVDMQLSATNLESEDGYGQLNLGVDVDHQLRDGMRLYASTALDQRLNMEYSEFNTGSISGRVGLQWDMRDNQVVRLGVDGGHYRLDGDGNRNSLSIVGEWRRPLDSSSLIAVSGQAGVQRYIDSEMESNDVDSGVLAVTWLRTLSGERPTILFANGYLGQEWESNERADGNKALIGARFGLQHQWTETVDGYASLGYQRGDYRRENVIFLVDRDDRMADLRFGGSWLFQPGWSLKGELAISRNDSNIGIYFSLSIRRQF